MIGGSTFLAEEVAKYLKNPAYAEQWIGFPDAAVDRIVPLQNMKTHFLFKLSLFVNGSLMIPTEKPKRFS